MAEEKTFKIIFDRKKFIEYVNGIEKESIHILENTEESYEDVWNTCLKVMREEVKKNLKEYVILKEVA